MAQLSEDERRRLFRAATGSPPPTRPTDERRTPVEQFQVEIKACTPEGKPVPSPVGPFPTREVAWTWWETCGTRLVDPYDVAEVNISPMYLTWRWDRYEWAPGDSSRIWINEQEEAEQARIAEQAKRNAH